MTIIQNRCSFHKSYMSITGNASWLPHQGGVGESYHCLLQQTVVAVERGKVASVMVTCLLRTF